MGLERDNHELALPGEVDLGGPEYASPHQPAGNLLIALRHHWLIVAIAWPVLMALAIPPIWLLVKPQYTASAHVKVDPVLSNLLDRQAQAMPLFDSYVATQAAQMSSGKVLTDALADPKLKDMPLLKELDPVAELRENLTVAPVPRTQIIRLDVTNDVSKSAITLADAILDSYLKFYGGSTEIDQNLDFLRKREKKLKDSLDVLRDDKRGLQAKYNATTDAMFEKLRELEAKGSEQTRTNRESVISQIDQLEEEKKQVESGNYMPLDDNGPSRQQQAIENNALVASLRQRLFAESDNLVKLQSGGLTDTTPNVITAKEQIERLKVELDKARTKALDDYDKEQQALQAKLKDYRLKLLNTKLESAKNVEQKLGERIKKQGEEDQSLGRNNIAIQSTKEEIEKTLKDLAEVEDARKKLEIEKSQPSGPGRVSKASSAEIFPEGMKDKRVKFTGVAIAGCLFAALGLAMIRSRFDPCVYAPTQVESQTGLRILGVVPSINELKRGRITEEEFAESYRLVRVNILSRALGEPPRSILVTSAQASEGKTSLAVSLAISLAELAGRVLLVDGDVQAPQLGRLLGLEGAFKLRDVLSGNRSVSASTVRSKLANLDVLLGGTNGDSSRGLIDPQTVTKLVQEAVGQYDFVVIDSPPALGTADSLIWSQAVDNVILSTFIGSSDIRATRHVCERLGMVGARILGAVVCNVTLRDGYAAYSSYSSSTSRSKPRAADEANPIFYLPRLNSGAPAADDTDDAAAPPAS